jgi:hypothetical protein
MKIICDYIDFNVLKDEIGIDWSQDTGDAGDHINIYGCEKTTRYLIDYLNENYDLPDHRLRMIFCFRKKLI